MLGLNTFCAKKAALPIAPKTIFRRLQSPLCNYQSKEGRGWGVLRGAKTQSRWKGIVFALPMLCRKVASTLHISVMRVRWLTLQHALWASMVRCLKPFGMQTRLTGLAFNGSVNTFNPFKQLAMHESKSTRRPGV